MEKDNNSIRDIVGAETKGIYVLLLKSSIEGELPIGSRLKIHLEKDRYYLYVGSALQGMGHRLARHAKKEKKMHWHIDYLLEQAKLHIIFFAYTREKLECKLSQQFDLNGYNLEPVAGFGNSDCRLCKSHLYKINKFNRVLVIKKLVKDAFSSIKLEPLAIHVCKEKKKKKKK